ncbi:unnamed protein product (mitochondrion) [Plasmodiophora brassicae]|uniref:Glycosyltransferase 2-like domain-containing protein n=2 Tax=Plasmodiophora brassicae TaxID=37360 RepID=A0A3P3YB75_PLABS|nr:unnamed protein product [Plasmodiophora brassicae]
MPDERARRLPGQRVQRRQAGRVPPVDHAEIVLAVLPAERRAARRVPRRARGAPVEIAHGHRRPPVPVVHPASHAHAASVPARAPHGCPAGHLRRDADVPGRTLTGGPYTHIGYLMADVPRRTGRRRPNMAAPRVTVIMPVHNGEATLAEAVRSIQSQTMPAWRLIIVDDGSTDGTAAIVDELAGGDDRIVVERTHGNVGVASALNRALQSPMVAGEYVARADADDTCHPQRLERQVEFLAEHPDVDLCGTQVSVDGRPIAMPAHACLADFHMHFYCSVAHPSVMWRRRRLDPFRYLEDPAFRRCEDYATWLRVLGSERRLGNVDGEPLVDLRRHARCVSIVHSAEQKRASVLAARDAIARLLGDEGTDADAVARIRDPMLIVSATDAGPAFTLIKRMHGAFRRGCRRDGTCPLVDEDVVKRLGEMAARAMQYGDVSLFKQWIQDSNGKHVPFLERLLCPPY